MNSCVVLEVGGSVKDVDGGLQLPLPAQYLFSSPLPFFLLLSLLSSLLFFSPLFCSSLLFSLQSCCGAISSAVAAPFFFVLFSFLSSLSPCEMWKEEKEEEKKEEEKPSGGMASLRLLLCRPDGLKKVEQLRTATPSVSSQSSLAIQRLF